MARRSIVPVPPNWFATVMGTSIVATAAHGLPVRLAGLDALAWAAWVLAAALLLGVTSATLRHLMADRTALRTYLDDPAVAPFYGATAMAFLAFGAATLLVTEPALGPVAVAIDGVLWVVGTLLGLATAIGVPVLAFTRHRTTPDAASGTWLMPIVPPMVSAATGALLLPYVPSAVARELALACYAMAGLAGIGALVVIAVIWARLAHHGVGPVAAVPTLWIVLGPLGQSITAMGLLADHAGPALGISPRTLALAAVLVGVPVLGFAVMWLAIAATITTRTRPPFTLAWWAFTFPVGTLVTGTSSLASHTGSVTLAALTVALFALLLGGWGLAATGTMRLAGRMNVPQSAATAGIDG